MKFENWKDYNASEQDIYLDEENIADDDYDSNIGLIGVRGKTVIETYEIFRFLNEDRADAETVCIIVDEDPEKEAIKALVKQEIIYSERETFDDFVSDYGYDSRWMYLYHNGADDEPLTDAEEEAIDELIAECWKELYRVEFSTSGDYIQLSPFIRKEDAEREASMLARALDNEYRNAHRDYKKRLERDAYVIAGQYPDTDPTFGLDNLFFEKYVGGSDD